MTRERGSLTMQSRRRYSAPQKPVGVSLVHSYINLWSTGMTVGMGGHYFAWNTGLVAGPWSFGLAVTVMGMAYICLCCCLGEVTSMVPFTGGAFGLARWTFGFHAGFLVGCCESLQYILYVTCNFVQLSRFTAVTYPSSVEYPYVTWIGSYMLAVGMLCCNSATYNRWNRLLAFLSLGLLVTYVIGSIPLALSSEAVEPNVAPSAIVQDVPSFFQTLPQAAWFFAGVETLNRLCNEVESPNISIPRSQLGCLFTLICTALTVFVMVNVLPPGLPVIATSVAPFNHGFTRMFNCSVEAATLLSIPATFASGQGFAQAYTNIIVALCSSRLLPEGFLVCLESTGAPIVAIALGTFISFVLCFMHYYVDVNVVLFDVAMLYAFVAYLSQCIGYIYLRREHSKMHRPFKSPFGIYGALFASGVWVASIGGLVLYQDIRGPIFALGLLGVCSMYYKVYAQKHQVFSTQENKALLFAHVARLNSRQAYRRRSVEGFAGELVKLINPPSKYKQTFPTMYKTANKKRQRSVKATVAVATSGRSIGREVPLPSEHEDALAQARRVVDAAITPLDTTSRPPNSPTTTSTTNNPPAPS
ncbi:hypothetical protein DYB26_003392 [Aphanomyces astaci]|uniref:Amino acid permease/ SLC12A domain-containing protein n=1 Tax=Aphanomyces astaci TaxID=112090 RepID=A0A418FAT6_APHAT|nr:hypothetical protein DYB26_003392 [Aphanomyces astaci]